MVRRSVVSGEVVAVLHLHLWWFLITLLTGESSVEEGGAIVTGYLGIFIETDIRFHKLIYFIKDIKYLQWVSISKLYKWFLWLAFWCSSQNQNMIFYLQFFIEIGLREDLPCQNQWFFGKVPKGLWPPSFSENYIANFWDNHAQKVFLIVFLKVFW